MIPLGAGSTIAIVDGGKQRLELLEGERLVNRPDRPAGATVLVLQAGGDRGEQRLAIDAIERPAEQAVATVEEREAEIPLLHAPRILGARRGREPLEQVRHGGPRGIAQRRDRLRGLDAEPDVVGIEGVAEFGQQRGGPLLEHDRRLARPDRGVLVVAA
jgi:hypothetical protein